MGDLATYGAMSPAELAETTPHTLSQWQAARIIIGPDADAWAITVALVLELGTSPASAAQRIAGARNLEVMPHE